MPNFTPAAWKTLLARPADLPTAGKSVRLANKKQANQAMWTAIDRNDPAGMELALVSGAALTNRRKGTTPLGQAVANGQWEIAELLRRAGADIHTRTQSGYTLFDALFNRDLIEEADRLLSWGCDPRQTTGEQLVLGHGAPNLLQWWLEHGNMDRIPRVVPGEGIKTSTLTSVVCWACTAARGSEQLRAHLNKTWGMRAWDPEHFAYAFGKINDVAAPLWTRIFQRDSVEMARGCLASGWGPPARTVDHPHMFLWKAASAGAWNVVHWFRQVPEFRKAMDECARQEPDQWWKCATSTTHLDKLRELGMDFQQVDKKGRTVAHNVLSANKLSPAMVDWFVRRYPELLSQPDLDGLTPLAAASSPALRAQAEAKLLRTNAPAATARKTTTRL